MNPTTRNRRARLLTLVAGFSLVTVLAAAAQTPPAEDDAEMSASEEAREAAANEPDILKDIDISKLDWSQLNVDASTLTGPAPKGGAAPKGASADATWSNNAKPNGTSAV